MISFARWFNIESPRVLLCLNGKDLDMLLIVLFSHRATQEHLLQPSLWHHLYQIQFQQKMPTQLGRLPHQIYMHMSNHQDWMDNHVHVIKGTLGDTNISGNDVLVFPTTPNLLTPLPATAAGAVHRLVEDNLQVELLRMHQNRGNRLPYAPGTAIRTQGIPLLPHLIHCVGPRRGQTNSKKTSVMVQAYVAAFSKIIAMSLRRVVVIPIGTGLAACPLEQTARNTVSLLGRILGFYCRCPQIEQWTPNVARFPFDDITFLCREADVYEEFLLALRNYKVLNPPSPTYDIETIDESSAEMEVDSEYDDVEDNE